MKRLVKIPMKVLWRGTGPLRRPVLRRLEAYLSRCLRPSDHLLSNETSMIMDQMVRELVRLRRQVESLQRVIDELAPSRERLAVAGEIEPES